MNYTIYRGSWRRGGDRQELTADLGDTSLYQARTKMMCCLGQCAFELGVSLEKLEDVGEPADVCDEEDALIFGRLLNDEEDWGRQSKFSNEAIGINDNEAITDKLREELLTKLAVNHGHTVTFVDGVAPWFAEVAA
jgi:hypothetical protein